MAPGPFVPTVLAAALIQDAGSEEQKSTWLPKLVDGSTPAAAMFDGNPVVKHNGRDPKLIWHAPTKKWVMAVYDEGGKARDVAFYTSPDLKKWAYRSRVGGFYECPDLFPLPVGGDPGDVRWVLSAADGKYVLGQFDGRKFVKESGKHQVWYGNFYATKCVHCGYRMQ